MGYREGRQRRLQLHTEGGIQERKTKTSSTAHRRWGIGKGDKDVFNCTQRVGCKKGRQRRLQLHTEGWVQRWKTTTTTTTTTTTKSRILQPHTRSGVRETKTKNLSTAHTVCDTAEEDKGLFNCTQRVSYNAGNRSL